ncbi:glycosyltransferase [Mucilaginibacter sp. PAMB04274]|uniref:glycosyltransferase n=1 Tax=Mucilaginibacter sp. PAMB04274 TaxID=3138568 RepID=UPI0031F71E1E
MDAIIFLSVIVQLALSSYLWLPIILLCFSFAAKLFKHTVSPVSIPGKCKKSYKFGIIITAHRETKFLPPIVDSILKQTYQNFEIYIVADDCDISGLHFTDERIHLLKPETPLNTNTKSIQYAIDRFSAGTEVMVIFDPDNLLHPTFLEVMNNYYNAGYKAVQANLNPKSVNGMYEEMDNAGATFYSFLDRTARTALGFSVTMWGCGVSVLTSVYAHIKYNNKSNMGGFDKHMQAEIVQHVPVIAYAPEAVFFDEKVSDAKNLESQRARWINAYFKFFPEGFKVMLNGIFDRNVNVAFFGYNLIRPPYFLEILIAVAFIIIGYFTHQTMMFFWIGSLLTFLISFISIVLLFSPAKSRNGLWYMPLFFFHQVRSMLKIGLNKRSILKTEHFKVLYIDDVI